MALPSLDKTWQFDINQELLTTGNSTDDFRQILLAIKNSLVGFASNPWTVIASSDGTTADGTDRWNVPADLNWGVAPAAHSWIQLRQSGIATNFELIIDLSSVSSSGIILSWSGTGFTGGSINNRPTPPALDEVIIVSGGWGPAGPTDLRLHVMQSSDGECTRFFCFGTYSIARYKALFLIDKAKNPVSGWTVPAVTIHATEHDNVIATYYDLHDTDPRTKGYHGKQIQFYLTSEFYRGAAVGQWQTFANDIDGAFPLMPVGLFSATSGVRGRHGQLSDLWWGSVVIPMYAGSYPEGAGRQFIHFGNLVFPWDGSVMLRYGGP